MKAGAITAPPLATPSVRRKARRLRNGRWWAMAAPPGLAVISEIRGLSMRMSEPCDLRSGQARPQLRQARQRRCRKRSLTDAGRSIFQLVETRVAEQDGRDWAGGQREAQGRLHEAAGVALVDQRAQHPRVPRVQIGRAHV